MRVQNCTWRSIDSLPWPRWRGDSAPEIALPAPLSALPAAPAIADALPHFGELTPPPPPALPPGGV